MPTRAANDMNHAEDSYSHHLSTYSYQFDAFLFVNIESSSDISRVVTADSLAYDSCSSARGVCSSREYTMVDWVIRRRGSQGGLI